MTEFALPAPHRPGAITTGPDHNLWFTEPQEGDDVWRVTPDGSLSHFPLGGPGNGFHEQKSITPGSDGNLWFTVRGSPSSTVSGDSVGRITPAGAITLFPLPKYPGSPYRPAPAGITTGPDGNLWFAEPAHFEYGATAPARIGRMTPGGDLAEAPIPTQDGAPAEIVAGPDNHLWFTESVGNKIGRLTPNS